MVVQAEADPTFTVTWTNDEDDVNACNNTSITSGAGADGNLSLREAVCEANNNAPSASTINIGPGTYDLTGLETGELQVGPNAAYSLSIVGTGTSSNTIIKQTDGKDRIIERDPNLIGNIPVTIENVTLTGGNCTTGMHLRRRIHAWRRGRVA